MKAPYDSEQAKSHLLNVSFFTIGLTELPYFAMAHGHPRRSSPLTMHYTHISLDDQAKALQSLPTPCQDIVRKSTGSSSPKLAADVQESPDGERGTERENPCNCRGYVTKCQPMSSIGTEFDEWRRRESNPQALLRNPITGKQLTKSEKALAAGWQRFDCQSTTAAKIDAQVAQELHLLHAVWLKLDAEARRAVPHLISAMQRPS